MVVPGRYTARLTKIVRGQWTPVGEPQSFEAAGLYELPAADRAKLLAFERKVARLQRAVSGASEAIAQGKDRVAHLKQALLEAPAADSTLASELGRIERELSETERAIKGDSVLAARNEPTPPSISERVNGIVDTQWYASAAPTATSQEAYRFAASEFQAQLEKLRGLLATDLRKVEDALEVAGAPWTPGRIPTWRPE
jgi:hypothetical protein